MLFDNQGNQGLGFPKIRGTFLGGGGLPIMRIIVYWNQNYQVIG